MTAYAATDAAATPPVAAARASGTARCPHCGAPVEGEADAFCCTGCEAAAAIIHGAGLDAYYATRATFAPRPGDDANAAWSAVPVASRPDGTCEVRLMVDGLRCASCVWLIEQLLERTPGVTDATVSYATGRASLRWDPARVDLATLAGRVAALGYTPRSLGAERRPDRDLLLRLGLAAFLALNLMGISEALYAGWWGGMEERWRAFLQWLALALATPIALWAARPFFAGAWHGLLQRRLHMDLPIALGVAILYVHGAWATVHGGEAYLDSLGMLVTLLLAGRMLESRGRRRAAEAATSLAASAPRAARRATGAGVEIVPVAALRRGDVIDVGAGEELAADGTVISGEGQVRVALLTGESAPVPVATGDPVVAGAVVVSGAISVRVDAVGSETMLHAMAVRLEEAAEREMRPTAADRVAPWFTLATLMVAALTFVGWALMRDAGVAVARTVAVLVVACPCALALSQPLAGAAGLGAAARRGLLMRSPDALLEMADADLVVLDKTGTVTGGALVVVDAPGDVLRVAAGLERFSSHPIARAIVAEAARRGIPLPRGAEVGETPGVGITGVVDGVRWTVRTGGAGEVLVERSDHAAAPGRIVLGDAVRTDAAATIAALRRDGCEVALLTGDHPEPARRIANAVGIGTVLARQTPMAKVEWVEARRHEGRRILFAGDGLNDGPALSASDVGIAMGSGAASSVLVADGVIISAAIAPLLAGRRAARAARRAIAVNQRRSIVYNVASVALAAMGMVNPLVAAVLMPLSSGMVIWGASRVERSVRVEES